MATLKLKEVFKTKLEDGSDVTLAVKRPDVKTLDEAQAVFNKAFMNAMNSKAPLRAKLSKIIREQNIWDDDKEKELEDIDKKITDAVGKIEQQKKSGLTKLELRKLALEVRQLRFEKLSLLSEQNSLDNMTCEAQAENRRHDFLVSACTWDDDKGEKFFVSLEDYLNRRSEQAAYDASMKLASMLNNFDPDWQKKLPENVFLLKYGYCNEDLNLTDPNHDNRLCDVDFKPVDKDGFYLDSNGKRVDREGNLLNEDGTRKVESEDFD